MRNPQRWRIRSSPRKSVLVGDVQILDISFDGGATWWQVEGIRNLEFANGTLRVELLPQELQFVRDTIGGDDGQDQ